MHAKTLSPWHQGFNSQIERPARATDIEWTIFTHAKTRTTRATATDLGLSPSRVSQAIKSVLKKHKAEQEIPPEEQAA